MLARKKAETQLKTSEGLCCQTWRGVAHARLCVTASTLQEGSIAGRTTNFARTKATLRGILTGLYPEAADVAVPIVTASDEDEILYSNVKSCARLGAILKTRMTSLKGEVPHRGDSLRVATC